MILEKDDHDTVSRRTSMGQIWQMLAADNDFEARQRWLAAAGWDPAGWTLQNWRQLPEHLQYDLAMLGFEKLEEIVLEGKRRVPR